MSDGWYVTAINITKWVENNPREAQETLPLLIKRLIFASVNASLVRFPSGDSIVLPGWDGLLKTDKGNVFIPTGDSAWEVSTEKTVNTKADSDYLKRTQEPGAVDKKKATFVFVTSQQWSELVDWVSEKKSKGQWADVKALSAEEITDWLSQCPAVHRWFARLIGNRPEGAWDAEQAWDGWSLATKPQCNTNLVIAGRNDQSDELSNFMSQSPEIIEVSSENKDEAYSFILASVKTHPWLLPRLLVVRDQKEWDLLIQSDHSLILIPFFDPLPTLGLAAKNGHWVLLPTLSQFNKNAKLALKKPSKDQQLKALCEMGIPGEDAEGIVNDSKYRLHIIRRHYMLAQAGHQKPEWADSGNAELIIAALLAGSWLSDNPNDREKLSYLADTSYDKLEQTLNKWLITGDFPVEHLGNKWQVVSVIDSWQLLEPFVTESILDRFGKVAVEVLSENDPRLELPPEERWLAPIHRKVTKYSVNFRHGLSEGLAILGSFGDRDCKNLTVDSIQAMVSYWLMQLLNDKMSETQWGSIAPVLDLLAEASPEVFLASVESSLAIQSPPVMSLFVDEGPMGGCPHLGLLRGLEYIAWDLDYTSRVASTLAKLALYDPGGKWANRPYNTLKEIFRGWLPQTKAPLDKRLEILDSLITYNSALGWKLLLDLLPGDHETSTPIGIPHFRDWAKGWKKGVSNSEYQQHVCAISERVLSQISKDPENAWLSVNEILTLPQPYLSHAIDQLDKDVSVLSSNTKLVLYNEVLKIISHHTKFSSAKWALPKECIEKLSIIHQKLVPEDIVARYKILFDEYFPPITNPVSYIEHEENERRGEKARLMALEEIWIKEGIVGIERLVNNVQFPGIVGNSLSSGSFGDSIEQSILRWQGSAKVKNQQAASSYIRAKAFKDKTGWLDTIYSEYSASWPEPVWVKFCLGLPFNKALFDFLEKFGEPVKNEYWKNVQMCYLTKEEAHYAQWVLEMLIGNNRPFTALEAAANYLQTMSKDAEISNELLLKILEQTMVNPDDIKTIRQDMLSYDFSLILKEISEDEKLDHSRIARVEWFYMPFFGNGDIHPKILINEVLKNPEFLIELICFMFRAHPPIDNEFSGIPTDVLKNRALNARRLVSLVNSIPGQKNTSEIDANELDSWVKQVRERCAQKNRKEIGDEIIGQILSHSPIGKDTIWPHEAVRDVIERYCSHDIERGLEVGRFNQRGVITRSLSEGGEQERKIAANYESQAELIRFKFPRTASMLKRMADTYKRDAIREDRDKELT
jgi:hypothetical protein